MRDEAAAQRRQIHENLCRVATQYGVSIKRIDVPFLVELIEELQNTTMLSIEQSLVLGTFMAGTAHAAIREQAAMQ